MPETSPRTILVTGVSSGIGRACAARFLREGWRVIGTQRNTASPEADGVLSGMSIEVLDLTVQGGGSDLAARVLERHGCPDVVLNNAGTLRFGAVEETDRADIETVFRVNVFETLGVTMGLVPAMRDRGSGVVANVTSLGGRSVFPFFGVYNASKHALEGFSEALWHELQPFGIRVKAIEPGFVQTPIYGKVMGGAEDKAAPVSPYASYLNAMREFEAAIARRTSPEEAADSIFRAITDESDRLRYPIAAYAKPILAARRILGEQRVMRFFHSRWMGRGSR